MSIDEGSSWLDTLVTDLNTGGKYHRVWEAGENIVSGLRDNKLAEEADKGEDLSYVTKSTPIEPKTFSSEYFIKYAKNPITWAISGVVILGSILLFKGGK